MEKLAKENLIREAKGLLEPGEELLNPEYTRALVELIGRMVGISYAEAANEIGVDYDALIKACDDASASWT